MYCSIFLCKFIPQQDPLGHKYSYRKTNKSFSESEGAATITTEAKFCKHGFTNKRNWMLK